MAAAFHERPGSPSGQKISRRARRDAEAIRLINRTQSPQRDSGEERPSRIFGAAANITYY